MTEPRSYTFHTATLHGKVVGGGIAGLGVLMLLIPEATVEDTSLAGLALIALGGILLVSSLKQSADKEPRLVVSDDGVWFRDWRIGTVSWTEIGKIYLGGSRLRPVICVELRDSKGFAARLPEEERARLWRNPSVRLPVLRISPKALDAPVETLLETLRGAQPG